MKKKMKLETEDSLLQAYNYCRENDKSTEFMLQYMQDFSDVDLDCVLNFLQINYEIEDEQIATNENETT